MLELNLPITKSPHNKLRRLTTPSKLHKSTAECRLGVLSCLLVDGCCVKSSTAFWNIISIVDQCLLTLCNRGFPVLFALSSSFPSCGSEEES